MHTPDPGSQNKKSLNSFHVESFTTAVEEASTAYRSPSLMAFGASIQDVAMFSAVNDIIIAFLYMKVPSMMWFIGSTKGMVITMAILNSVTWLPIILIMAWSGTVVPVYLVAIWIVCSIPGELLIPVRDSWLAAIIPATGAGRYLSIRYALTAGIYLGFFFAMGYMLDTITWNQTQGFALVFTIALLASLLGLVIYSTVKGGASGINIQVPYKLSNFLRDAKEPGPERFILYIGLINFSVYLCSPLFAVYLVKDLKLSYILFALVGSSDLIAKVLSSTSWGKYSDKADNVAILKKVSYFIPLIPFLWLISGNVFYLVAVQLFSGLVWAGFDVCSRSLICKTIPPEKLSSYMIHQHTLVNFFRGLGALVSVIILHFEIPVLGYTIFGLFLLSGIVRLIVVFGMLPKGKEAKEEEPRITRSFGIPIPKTDKTGNRGLYYRPEIWSSYGKKTKKKRAQFPRTREEIPRGLLYRPHIWEQSLLAAENCDENSKYKLGLYYRESFGSEMLSPNL
jgi:hypothetical protein